MSRLDDIVGLLVEDFIAQKVDLEHDAARESFRLSKFTVDSWAEFVQIAGAYYLHHFSQTIPGGERLPPEWAAGHALDVLNRAFKGGADEAYTNARFGTRGGLKAVIDMMAETIKQEYRGRWSGVVHATSYDPTNWDDVEELAEDFLRRYRHKLPAGAEAVNVGFVAGKIRDYLTAMAENVSNIRQRIRQR